MAWENALDRLLLQQIHLVEKGELRPEAAQAQVNALHDLAPQRPESAFHLGYARSLLGLDLPEPANDVGARRWYTYGRLRGHDRRGERNWVADLLTDPTEVMELLREPKLATQCLPVVMRTLFWCGHLDLAVKAIAYLASTVDMDTDSEPLVDAALADLLTRLESREDKSEEESTLSILQKCIELDCFERLPIDVRAGYLLALGQRQLEISEFDAALESFKRSDTLAPQPSPLASRAELGAAMACMRIHDCGELKPQADRPDREAATEWLKGALSDETGSNVPEAVYARAMLAYEETDYDTAIKLFDRCLRRFRRSNGRDAEKLDKTNFFLAAALLAGGPSDDASRALRLMDAALETVQPDLESFYSVHESLKVKDRKLALRFLDAVDIGRGTAPDQLLFVALEYLSLGEAEPASIAARRVLQVAVDLDQRIEALRVLLTSHNMQGDRDVGTEVYQEIRELLMQRGKFHDLENLLKNEEFVGQALDHLEIKLELVALYEEMEDREFEKASLQTQVARSMRARKDVGSLRQAFGLLSEVEITFPELAQEDMRTIRKLLELTDSQPASMAPGAELVQQVEKVIGHRPKILVVGGNERQRRHHPKFEVLAGEWGFEGEWLMANYSSPQRLVGTIGERLNTGVDLLILLHWNRHETTEPALELARKQGVTARTIHYAGFTSLQVCLTDQLERVVSNAQTETSGK